MRREEIKEQVASAMELDRQERRRLLGEQSVRTSDLLAPLIAQCASLGHEPEATGVTNIFGDPFLACKWCGTGLGVKTSGVE